MIKLLGRHSSATAAGVSCLFFLLSCSKVQDKVDQSQVAAATSTPATLTIATSAPIPQSSGKARGNRRARITLRRLSFAGMDGRVDIADILIDGPTAPLRVVDVISGVRTPAASYRSYSLREVIAALHPSF